MTGHGDHVGTMTADTAQAPPDGISSELYDELLRLRPCLERQGSVIQREEERGDVYRLRLRVDDDRVGRRHRAITIYGVRAAQAISSLIASWRAEREQAEQERNPPPPEPTECEKKVAELRRLFLRGAVGARRQRLARAFDEAAHSPTDLFFLMESLKRPEPRRRPGPRPRAGLC